MENIKIKKIAFILITLLISISVYFYSNKDSVVLTKDQDVNKEIVDEGTDKAKNDSGQVSNKEQDNNLEKISDQEKFNIALKNGSDYFIKGDYNKSINYYKEALNYNNSDVVHIKLYYAYNALGNETQALNSLDEAIRINPKYTDYWNSKISFLDQNLNKDFSDLKKVYQQGINSVDSRTKINLVTYFARISENKGQNQESIDLWKKAIELNPALKDIYQAEIDRLVK